MARVPPPVRQNLWKSGE